MCRTWTGSITRVVCHSGAMGVEVDPDLLGYMAANSGACTLVLEASPPEAAVRGLRAACRAVGAIPHPEEPSDPLPSHISAPEATVDGAHCTLDIADAEVYDGLLETVVQAVLDALAGEGILSGRLTFPSGPPPTPRPSATPRTAGPPAESPASRLPPLPAGVAWSSLGIPLPEPFQPLWSGPSEGGWMLPQEIEFLMAFFEALPFAVLSYTASPPDDVPYGLVYLSTSMMYGSICIRDAGTARYVEIQLNTDPAAVAETHAALPIAEPPPGTEFRLDRR